MNKIYHPPFREALLILLILLGGCSRPNEEQRDWDRIKKSATEFGLREVIEDLQKHLKTYPDCVHRGSAENYFVQSCKGSSLKELCLDYVKTFPNGARLAEVEEIFWNKCKYIRINCVEYAHNFPKGSKIAEVEEVLWLDCENGLFSCEQYIEAFPNGEHIAAARQRQELGKQKLFAKRKLEARQRAEIWSGPEMDVYLDLPYSASHLRITVKLFGDEVTPVASSYKVPKAFPTVDVCYDNGGGSFNDSNCTTMTLQPGHNRVPLSELRISAPKEFKLRCTIEPSSKTLFVEGTIHTGLFFMPGSHVLSCDVRGREYRSEFRSGFSHAESVKLTFEAPEDSGYIDAVYAISGAHIKAFVLRN